MSSKASKAAQKRARKKAAAKQAAGAAVAAAGAPPPPAAAAAATAAPVSAGGSHPQPHSGALGDAQTAAHEPSISKTAADMQQLDLDDASARTAASSPPAAPSGQSADDWMICPLTQVGGDSGQAYEKLAFVELCSKIMS